MLPARALRFPASFMAAPVLLLASCSDPEAPAAAAEPRFEFVSAEERENGPPTALWNVVESLRADEAAVRHPADGAGRAWLVEAASTTPAERRRPGHWVVVFEAGPEGVAEGGAVFLQISPFWGWSTPQAALEEQAGYTEVTTTADGVQLEPRTLDRQLLAVRIGGRALREGERIQFAYGGEDLGAAVADLYAEHESRFWVAVDGDGDGIRAVIPDSPVVEVRAGQAKRLQVTLPSTARPGAEVRLTLAFLDSAGNAGWPSTGRVTFPNAPAGLDLPKSVTLTEQDGGVLSLAVPVLREGIYRVEAQGPHSMRGVSNPLVVSADGPRVLWADLQGHGNFSDGTGTPEDYFRYARDVAALDAVSLTEHDHWGMLFLDSHADLWERQKQAVRDFHAPGRFVTLLGYEWTNWIHGHRHVVYFGDDGELFSWMDPATDTPPELWQALRGSKALTFAHHSAGDPIPVNWEFAPDPELEPVTEICSVHGSSEALDAPVRVRGIVPGNTVRDQLDRGVQLGFIGSGDSHDGHPGLTQIAGGRGRGGLAAILAEDLTRDAIYEALRERRCYATNGPRIFVRFALAGRRMGSSVPPAETAEARVLVVADSALRRVELVRSGVALQLELGDDPYVFTTTTELRGLQSGEYLYLRVVQEDDGAAWTSPFYVE